MINNPIIKGFNPDPSICYADGYFYLAVSTFEYFPGVTIYQSNDLINWRYISSALDSEENLDLHRCKDSVGGIYAPSIRYHNGTFYVVTTNKNIKWNYIVKSDNIKGPWSKPILVRQNGIDPSLFFDDDGSCFYISNGIVDGVRGILGGYIDPDSGKFLSDARIITQGISKCATEAPHIYKANGYYYLMFAEGGTGMGHHEEIMRAKTLDGPWEYRGKPILSHVDRKDYIIQATGHADLIQDNDGRYFAFFLGIRKANKPLLHQLGRESFIAPVTWIDGWPVIGKDGYVDICLDIPGKEQNEEKQFILDFSNDLSKYPILKLRREKKDAYIQDKATRTLVLIGDEDISTPLGEPTMLLMRQTDFSQDFEAILDTENLEGRAGVAAWYSNDYHYALNVEKYDDEKFKISLSIVVHGLRTMMKTILLIPSGDIKLRISTEKDSYSFFVDNIHMGTASYAGLCTEAMMRMTFTGTLFSIWSENGRACFKDYLRITTREH